MRQKGHAALARIDINEWFDYWHTHPDWDGKGNKCPENRRSTFELGYDLLKDAEELCKQRVKPIQCWAIFCKDTSDNAIYLHSENPNKSPFPYTFDGSEWGITDIPDLNDIVNIETHEIGKFVSPDDVVYVVRKRA